MDFASIWFVVFVLLLLTVYWLLAPHRELQKWLLLAASCLFYATFSAYFVTLLLLVCGFTYVCGKNLMLERLQTKRPFWLFFGVGGNLAVLGLFKYYNFFRDNLDEFLSLYGLLSHLPILNLVLPVGISFYTFQGIAYLVELKRGQGRPARTLLDFLLFQAFFPQLLIGPICRSKELLPQIEGPSPTRVEYPSYAFSLILSGLFKRVVMASLLFTNGVSETFYSPENYSALSLWVAMIGYSIQIYCDFSGYTDLMRGLALLFGFRIPENFRGPYASVSIGEFWRRWHMTFGAWLRDFIYFPLGGSKCRPARVYWNLLVTMLFCGIWHGASWGYVIWGSIHGMALVFHKAAVDLMRSRGIDLKATRPWFLVAAGWMWTFGVCSFSRIFFYAPDLESASIFLSRMFQHGSVGKGFDLVLLPIILLGLALNFVGTPIRRLFVNFSYELPWPLRMVFWAGCLLVVVALKPSGIAPHVYFRF